MILTNLQSRNFRNLQSGELGFHPRANLMIGRNGQGKTNILEAIYFLATSKSFRAARPTNLFRFGEPNLYVEGTVERESVRRALSVGLETGDAKRRVLMVNEEKVTLPTYIRQLTAFAYSAARLDVMRGTPEDRRRFIDRGAATVHPGYLELMARYARVLRQRNALLAEIAARQASPATLGAWDEELVQAGEAVQRVRSGYIEALREAYRAIVERYHYHVDSLELVYRPALIDSLEQLRAAEFRARTTLVGPQRDAIELSVDGRAAGEVLSGGEQKMVVLFLKFAKIELFRRRQGESPLFLLDDIDAELDLEILQDLLGQLPPDTQLFATSAKELFLASVAAGSHRRLSVENGRVTAVRDFD